MAFGGLTNWFKKRVEDVRDVFDANTPADQRRRLAAGQPRYYQDQQAAQKQVQPQQQFYNQPPSYGGGLNGLSNLFKDVFDANTPQDQYKRLSVGAPKDYVRQQAKLNQQAQQDPLRRSGIEQFGKNLLGGVAEFAGKAPGAILDFKGSYDKSTPGKILNYSNPLLMGQNLANLTVDKLTGKPIGTTSDRNATNLQKFGRGSQDIVENKIQQSSLGQRESDNKWIAGSGRAIGNVGGQVAATVLSGGTTIPALLSGSQTFSDQQKAAKQAGKTDEEAFGIGALQGLVESASEKIGLDKLKVPGAGNFAVKTLKRFGTEGTQEAGQQFLQNLVTNKTYNQNQGLTEGVKEAGIFGGLAGGVAGSAFDFNPKEFKQANQQLANNQIGAVGKNVNNPLESLKQEARKYKSAEEFVNSQRLYKGLTKDGSSTSSTFGKAVYTSPHEHIAQKYDNGGGLVEMHLKPGSRTINWQDAEYKAVKEKFMEQVPGGEAGYRKPNYDKINTELKKRGYDAVTFATDGQSSPMTAILNKKAISNDTKQLTDLYNQATQSPKSSPKTEVDVDEAFRQELRAQGMTVPDDYVQNKPTVTMDNLDRNRLKTDPEYQRQVNDSMFAVGQPTKEALMKEYKKAFGNYDKPKQSLLTVDKPKGFIIKETKPRGGKVDTVRITKDPVTGKMIKTIQSEDAPTPKDPYIKEYSDMLRDMESGLTGGQLISDHQGGKTRITEHSPFYRQVFKEKGRKPTRAEWYEEAQRQVEEGSADPAFMEYYNDVNSKRGALSNTVKVIDNKPSNKPSQAEWDALLAQAEREGIEPSKKALLKIRAENNQNIADAVMAGDTEYANQLRDQAKDVSAKIRISANENNPNTAPDIPEATPTQVRDLRDKQTKADFETYTKQYLGDTRSAKIERDSTIVELNKKHKLTNEEKLNAIVAADDPTVEPMNQKVEDYLKDFRQLTDEAYRYYTQDRGIKMGFVSSYLPRIYRNPANGQAISGQEYKLLQQGSARQRGREAETLYEDALIYKDPTKLLDSYYKSLDQAAAGQAYMQNLEKNGLVVASSENVRGLRPILAEGIQTPDGMHYYANKDVATKLNTMFGNREASNVVEKLMEKAAGINSVMQSFVLSGGIPNTPINAFGIMQVMKESMALHPIKAGKAFYVGMNKSAANNLFTKKKDILKLMAENDVNPRVDLQEVSKRGYVRIAEADNKVNSAWNEFTNDATFKRFMPALEILHFEQMYKAQLRKTGDSAKAAQIAADSVKNFYGKVSDYKQSTRAQLVDDTSGALLFAPRFRESMLNFWGKNIKALGHPTKPEYRDNIKFLIAAAVVYGAMEGLNKELNGVWMHDNPDGKKDKLLIPADKLKSLGINTEGKDIGVPFLSSISTIPRNAIFGAANLATGNFKEAGKNAKTALSMPLNLAGDIVTNENYFGQPIVQEGSNPADRFKQVASYAITGNMQPWLREGLNIAGQKLPDDVKKSFGIKKKSTVETISNATESPFRFYDPKYYRYGDSWTPRGGKGEKFTISEQRDRAEIKKEMNSIPDSLGLSNTQKAKYKSLNSYDFDEKGNLKLDNNPFYQAQRATALQDDGVFEAMRQKAVLENKLNGKPLDPIYNLSPSERRVILWKKTLPQGTQDPTISKLYDQEWYQDYRGEEDRYFREKNSYNKKMGYDNAKDDTNPYPEPSKGLAKKLDYYYTLPKGTGARSAFLNSNPDVLAQWDKVENWKNGERAQVGLGPLDEYQSQYAYGSKSGYSRSRSGRKGSRGGRKSKSPNLPSFTIANYPRVNKVKISSKKAPSTTLKVPTVKIKTSKAKITIAKQAKKIKKTSSMV